jgi:hypothetical protein
MRIIDDDVRERNLTSHGTLESADGINVTYKGRSAYSRSVQYNWQTAQPNGRGQVRYMWRVDLTVLDASGIVILCRSASGQDMRFVGKRKFLRTSTDDGAGGFHMTFHRNWTGKATGEDTPGVAGSSPAGGALPRQPTARLASTAGRSTNKFAIPHGMERAQPMPGALCSSVMQ